MSQWVTIPWARSFALNFIRIHIVKWDVEWNPFLIAHLTSSNIILLSIAYSFEPTNGKGPSQTERSTHKTEIKEQFDQETKAPIPYEYKGIRYYLFTFQYVIFWAVNFEKSRISERGDVLINGTSVSTFNAKVRINVQSGKLVELYFVSNVLKFWEWVIFPLLQESQ